MKFIPLYVKTSYSLLSSLCDIKKMINKCVELNITSIAITDSNMYGVMEFYKECKKNNIKPIIGLELVIDNNIVLLYAKNYMGYQNLTRLNFEKQNKSLDIEDLKKYSDNLICITNSSKYYNKLINVYENIYLGYLDIEDNKQKSKITDNLVFINEILCLDKFDIEYLKYVYLIRDGKKHEDINDYLINENCYLSYCVKSDYYKEKEISDLCNVEFSFNMYLLPKYNVENNFSEKEYLFELCKKGLYKRLNTKVKKVYYDRLLHELNIIDNMGFNSYFLVVWDFIKYARKNNIMGYARGSAVGSLVSYSLGITDVDPIKYDLFFERFLNPERVSMPDIDIDFESNRRADVVNYVINKYGKKRAVPIITFTTLGGRQVLRDVGRVLNIETKHLDVICKYIGFNTTLQAALKNKNLENYLNSNKELRNLYNISLKLDGLKRQISTHAAGIIISNLELDSYIPLQKYDDYYISGFSMEHLEELGLLKMDFLGLRNLTLIDSVLSDINKSKSIKFSDIPLDDKETLELFSNGVTEGIFQFESNGMKNFLKKLKPNSFNDIVAAIALFRPGPSENIDSYIRRKNNKEKIEYIHDALIDVLKPTYGIIIYQEQIMKVVNIMAGYSLGEADVLRRAMSKKKKEIFEEEKQKFIDRSIKEGISKEDANKIYELILKFANYGFNKSHSVAYSMIAFKMAYLKLHYSEYFMSALLTNSIGNESKTKEYIDECKKMGINILKPCINDSDYKYKRDCVGIRFSLAAINNVGGIACRDIMEERKKGNFTDFFNFVARMYGSSVNKKTILSLIDADCFSDFGFNHRTLYENIDSAINYASLIKEIDDSLVEKPIMDEFDEFDKETLLSKEFEVFGFYLSKHPVTIYKSKYDNIIDTNNIINYFNKFINIILFVESIKEIQTKNNDKMCFVNGSDEFGYIDLVIFPNIYMDISILNKRDIIYVGGKVERRMNKYQIIVNKIEKL